MAIAANHLTTGGSSSTAEVYSTASVTIAQYPIIVIVSGNEAFSTASDPTLTGQGLSWVQIGSRLADGSDIHHFHAFVGLGTPSGTPGTIDIDFGTTPTNDQTYCRWSLYEFSGVDRSTPGNEIVQAASNTGAGVSSLTCTLGAFSSVNNATYGGFGTAQLRTFTAGSGFTGLQQNGSAGNGTVGSEYQLANDTTVDMSFSSTSTCFGWAFELKAQGANATASPATLVTAIGMQAPAFVTGNANASPAVLAAPVAFPAPTIRGTANTTPSVLTSAVTFPAPTAFGSSSGAGLATPGTLTAAITFPTPIARGAANVTPAIFGAGIEFPTPTVEVTGLGVAHPATLAMSIGFSTYSGTTSETFSPPAALENPPVLPSTRGPARSLFRHYQARPVGHNVFYMKDGTVTENDPVTTYDADGNILEEAWSRVAEVFWGGHEGQIASPEAAAALQAAGYTLQTDAVVS